MCYEVEMINRESDEKECTETYEVYVQTVNEDRTTQYNNTGWYVEDKSVRGEDGTLSLVATRIYHTDGRELPIDGGIISGIDNLHAFLNSNLPVV